MTQDGYLLDNAVAAAGAPARRARSAVRTRRRFRHIGRARHRGRWRCWEVGAGGASVVRWLRRAVGPAGRVLATDIECRGPARPPRQRDEIRRHDVAADPPPDLVFDLVHAASC